MPPFDNHTHRRTDAYFAWGVCGFLVVAVGLIYGQTLGHVLLNYDDSGFVFANPHVTPGLSGEGIWWAFTDGPYGDWYPLAPLSHMLDCQLFGLHAWGHHLTNVLLHAAGSIALFLVLWRMTSELWPSAFVATVFAVHPQHVESVAWVSERRDVLSGLFFMLTLAAYLGYVSHGRSLGRYLLAAVFFALALMAKPMVVTLPPLLLLLDFWPLARCGFARDTPAWTVSLERPGMPRLLLEKLPLAALAAGDCLITWSTHRSRPLALDWSERIGNAAVCYVTYVVQFFYPLDLAVFYPYPQGGLPTWKVAGAIAVLLVTSAAAVFWRRPCPYFFVGWFWYLGMLTPVLGLITVADHAMADRYMYLPGIGLYVAIVWGAARLAASLPEGRWLVIAAAGPAIAVLITLAAWQTSFWSDDETLWTRALACTADNAEAEFALAEAFKHQGRLDEAVDRYRRAEQFGTDVDPFNNLGLLFAEQGKLADAIAEYRRALTIDPNAYATHTNLADALAQQNQFDESIEHFHRALEIDPRGVSAHIGLAHLLISQRKIDDARAELERAVAIDPKHAAAQNDLASALFELGRIDESIRHYEAALAIDPNFVMAHVNLADELKACRRIDEAAAHYRRALELDPNNARARAKLEKLLPDAGQPPREPLRTQTAGRRAASVEVPGRRCQDKSSAASMPGTWHKRAALSSQTRMHPSEKNTQRRTQTYYAWAVCALILLAIGLIYGQTLQYGFLDYDDNGFVYESPHVTAGLTTEGIEWAFTVGPFGEWYPLAPLSHMLDCQLFGLHAWGHHLTNVLLHAAASIALFLVLWRMTGELWPSAFVATVFAVHPQHVESVAWVSERRDVLSGLFFMLTLAAYLGYVSHGRSLGRYLLAAVFFALALMAKPMVVTLPPLLLLLDFWPLARCGFARDTPRWTVSVKRPGLPWLVLEKLPFLAVAVGDCLMTWRTHRSGNMPFDALQRIGNAAVSCVTYVFQFFYPVDLAAFYPYPAGGQPAWEVAGAFAILGATSAAVVLWRRRCPYIFVGWFWYLGMLTPVLGIVQIAAHAMADRYMYLPGIGLYVALAWGAARLAAGSPEARWTVGTCAGLAIAILVACAAWQTSVWRDDETLWRHALSCTTDNGEAELGLADAFNRQGRRDEAILHYRRAQQRATDSAPFNNLGALLALEGNLEEATALFRRALEIEPDSYRAHANLGRALARQNRFDESLEHFRRALELNPLVVNTHHDLAHLLLFQGKIDEARAEFERAVELDPRNTGARNDLAATLLQQGKFDQAIPHLKAVLAIDPSNPVARDNLDKLSHGNSQPPKP